MDKLRIYLTDVRPLYREQVWRRVYGGLSAERRQKADACGGKQARALSLAAGFLAEYALAQNGYDDFYVCNTENGQPITRCRNLMSEGKLACPCLSLSHSGDYAVCAVCKMPVGVDIQRIEPVRTGILRHFFTEEEAIAFKQSWGVGDSAFLPEGAALAFFRLWALKESYMKLTGRGMALGFDRIWVEEASGRIGEKSGGYPVARYVEYKMPPGYVLAACRAL